MLKVQQTNFMSYLRYLCLFACGGVQHVLAVWVAWRVFCGWLPFAGAWVHLRVLVGFVRLVVLSFLCRVFCFVCLPSMSCVHVILPVSLDCPFLISPSGFFNVYFQQHFSYIITTRFIGYEGSPTRYNELNG